MPMVLEKKIKLDQILLFSRKRPPRTSTIVQFIFYFGPLRSAIIF